MDTSSEHRAGIQISCSRDGSKAVLDVVYPESYRGGAISMTDVEAELKIKGIRSGILWDNIKYAVKKAVDSNEPQRNVVIAKANVDSSVEKFFCFGEEASRGDIHNYDENFQSIHKLLTSGYGLSDPCAGACFVKENEIFLRHEYPPMYTDIFGTEKRSAGLVKPFHEDESIVFEEFVGEADYKASGSGFIAKNDDGKIYIASPFIVSRDRLLMTLVLPPLLHGEEEFWELLKEYLAWKHDGCFSKQLLDLSGIREKARTAWSRQGVYVCELRKGTPPTKAVPAKLVRHIQLKTRPQESNDEKIDYAELTPYQEIKEGTLVAEKILRVEGEPGTDVFGEVIPTENPDDEDFAFTIGSNIREENTDFSVEYIADCDGVLYLTEESAHIEKELIIKGDVSLETGNLHCDVDVIVQGDIKGSFAVECGGNLTVKGTVENGANIICRGSMAVIKGIVGDRTRVSVEADAIIGFLQDCKVRIAGNLTVRDYIMNAHVSVTGNVELQGKAVKGDTRGALIGGVLNAMGDITLHSVGSNSCLTEIECGIDRLLLSKIMDLERLLPVTTKKIAKVQSEIGVDLTQDDVKEKLRVMPAHIKERLKANLLRLKEATQQHEEIVDKKRKLEERAYSDNLDKLSIRVEKHLVPEVSVMLGRSRKVIEKNRFGVTFQLSGDVINMSGLNN